MPTLYLVELFSGSSSVANAIAKGLPVGWRLQVHSVDIHPEYNPTTAVDILKWDYKKVLQAFLRSASLRDVVWVHASPPCTEYSRAKTSAPRDLPLADGLVKRSLRVIKYCKGLSPSPARFFWTLENPVGLLRTRSFMQPLEPYLHTTSYCRWGKPFRKDTDIWTNVAQVRLPLCRKGNYCAHKGTFGYHGSTAQAGGDDRTEGSGRGENVYPIPGRLTTHLLRTALERGNTWSLNRR
jgi:hypothetical protein